MVRQLPRPAAASGKQQTKKDPAGTKKKPSHLVHITHALSGEHACTIVFDGSLLAVRDLKHKISNEMKKSTLLTSIPLDRFFCLLTDSRELQDDENISVSADQYKEFKLMHLPPDQALLDDVRSGVVDFRLLPKYFQCHRDLVLAAVTGNGGNLLFASEPLRADPEIVLAALGSRRQHSSGCSPLGWASEELRGMHAIVLEAVTCNGQALHFASPSLQAERNIVEIAVRQNGLAIQHAPGAFKEDLQMVLLAVKGHGEAMQYIPELMRQDKQVVLAAVQSKGGAIRHALGRVRFDPQILRSALKQSGLALEFMSQEVQSEENYVRLAVQQNGRALKYASDDLRSDRELVYTAVKRSAMAFEFASPALRGDLDMAVFACKNCKKALKFVPSSLRDLVISTASGPCSERRAASRAS